MVQDYFIHTGESYENGDYSIRYYSKSDTGYTNTLGVIRLNVTDGFGALSQRVIIITGMELNGVVQYMSEDLGFDQQQALDMIQQLREHSVDILTPKFDIDLT